MKPQKIWASLDPFFEGKEIVGRTVANERFLRALLGCDPFDAYHFFPGDKNGVQTLSRRLKREFPDLWSQGKFQLEARLGLPRALAKTPYHCFHLSDCINFPAPMARLRNAHSPEIFPITSVTHSLSYSRYAKEMLTHLWPGATPRDCVVVTSEAARHVVSGFYETLRRGFGLDREGFPGPGLEKIPLGVDTGEYRPPSDQERMRARNKLGIPEDCRMLLIFARISHHSKMDVLPVFRAVQRLFRDGVGPKGLCLYLAGWMDEKDGFKKTLLDLAANIGLDLRVAVKPDEAAKKDLFWACDLFLSPADNPQETFGLTVLEAGAFGCPTVASDYDGYRDLIVPGKTGALVPTIGPDQTGDVDDLAPVCFENHYHLLLTQQTVVEVPELYRALSRILDDEESRRRMGWAARRHVEENFSWERVIRAYVALWDRLWDAPVDIEKLRGKVHPLHLPYSRVFSGHATRNFGPGITVQWTLAGQAVYRERDFVLVYETLKDKVLVETLKKLLFFARKPGPAVDLAERLAQTESLTPEEAHFYVLWAMKHDLLERVDE